MGRRAVFQRRQRVCAVVLTLALLGLTVGCGRRETMPVEATAVLEAMLSAMETSGQVIPDGRIYSRSVPTDAVNYLGDTLFSAIFGEAARGLLMSPDGALPAVGDVALFLSTAPHPTELVVLRCSDARGCATVAKLCRGRLDTVANAWAGSEWALLLLRQATVSVEGAYVLLVIAEDPAPLIRAATSCIRE